MCLEPQDARASPQHARASDGMWPHHPEEGQPWYPCPGRPITSASGSAHASLLGPGWHPNGWPEGPAPPAQGSWDSGAGQVVDQEGSRVKFGSDPTQKYY